MIPAAVSPAATALPDRGHSPWNRVPLSFLSVPCSGGLGSSRVLNQVLGVGGLRWGSIGGVIMRVFRFRRCRRFVGLAAMFLVGSVLGAVGSGTVDVGVAGASSAPTFVGLKPARLLDTRSGVGAPAAKVGAGQTLVLQVTGRGGVPSSGVAAVSINITATRPTVGSYLTVWPTGQARPTASILNFAAGQTIANSTVVGVSASGQVSIFNSSGSTDVLVDVSGWFPSAGVFTPLTPARLLDTHRQVWRAIVDKQRLSDERLGERWKSTLHQRDVVLVAKACREECGENGRPYHEADPNTRSISDRRAGGRSILSSPGSDTSRSSILTEMRDLPSALTISIDPKNLAARPRRPLMSSQSTLDRLGGDREPDNCSRPMAAILLSQ